MQQNYFACIVFLVKNICVDYVLFILNRSLQSYLVCLRKLSATCIHDNHVKQVLSRYSLTCHKNPWEEPIGKYNSRSKLSFYFYIYWNFCPFFLCPSSIEINRLYGICWAKTWNQHLALELENPICPLFSSKPWYLSFISCLSICSEYCSRLPNPVLLSIHVLNKNNKMWYDCHYVRFKATDTGYLLYICLNKNKI